MKQFFSMTLLLLWQSLQGQGCSDAGFCSIQGMNGQPVIQDTTQNPKFSLSLSANIGRTFQNILLFSPILEGNYQVNQGLQLSLRLVSALRWHEELTVFGLADAFISSTITIHPQHKLILGCKVPFHRANQTYEGISLPMPFQTSLGTYDLIAGYAFQIKRLSFHLGIQYPIIQNLNAFVRDSVLNRWGEGHFLAVYTNTYQFRRSGDALVRVSYQSPDRPGGKWKFVYSVLGIYHLQNDTYGVVKQPIQGSQGLTLNLNATASYSVRQNQNIEMLAGFPVIARKVRPEGLSTFTLQVGYKIYL